MQGKFNLAAFKHAIMDVARKDGSKVKCIVIPIEENSLFLSDKGNVYCDWRAWELAPEKRKGEETHLINQSLKKEVRDALKAAGKYAPTIGTIREPQPEAAETVDNTLSMAAVNNGDDLPF